MIDRIGDDIQVVGLGTIGSLVIRGLDLDFITADCICCPCDFTCDTIYDHAVGFGVEAIGDGIVFGVTGENFVGIGLSLSNLRNCGGDDLGWVVSYGWLISNAEAIALGCFGSQIVTDSDLNIISSEIRGVPYYESCGAINCQSTGSTVIDQVVGKCIPCIGVGGYDLIAVGAGCGLVVARG